MAFFAVGTICYSAPSVDNRWVASQRSLAAGGSVDAMFRLYVVSLSYADLVDAKDGLMWLRRAAEGGHVMAQFCYGNYLLNQPGSENLKTAKLMLGKASSSGNAKASLLLGGQALKEISLNIPDAGDNAFRFFVIARNQGEVNAVPWIAWCYFYGYGVHENKPLAVGLWDMAARSGNELSMLEMLDYAIKERDVKSALSWYEVINRECKNIALKERSKRAIATLNLDASSAPVVDAIVVYRESDVVIIKKSITLEAAAKQEKLDTPSPKNRPEKLDTPISSKPPRQP